MRFEQSSMPQQKKEEGPKFKIGDRVVFTEEAMVGKGSPSDALDYGNEDFYLPEYFGKGPHIVTGFIGNGILVNSEKERAIRADILEKAPLNLNHDKA